MSKHYIRIPLIAAAFISVGLTTAGHAFAGDFPQRTRTKQLVEGLYTENLDAASYFQQGLTRYNRSDFKGAEQAFRQALTFDPFIPMAHYLLGNSLFQQGQTELATEQYKRAIGLDPNMAEAYYNLGLTLYKQANVQGAITQYQKALSLNRIWHQLTITWAWHLSHKVGYKMRSPSTKKRLASAPTMQKLSIIWDCFWQSKTRQNLQLQRFDKRSVIILTWLTLSTSWGYN
jgi:tetratricopeptide (TPR) repeat protein